MFKNSQRKNGLKTMKTLVVFCLTIGLLLSNIALPIVLAEGDEIVFKIQSGGTYDGMPLFDGDPDHIDAFVETFFEYVGVEGAAVYATESRNSNLGYYELTTGANSGKKIPSGHRAHDHVQGVSTDFPTMTALGQTWNKDLLAKVGTVLGDEQLNTVSLGNSEQELKDYNPVFYTAVSDIRINPLSGRVEESFAEDATLTAEMVKYMTGGATGTILPESENGFWLKAIVGSKHFPNYAAQWFRTSGNKDTSVRSLMEYHTKTVLKGVSAGSITGVMSSYGRTNGVPNILSPLFNYVRSYAPYAFYTSPDANAYNHISGVNVFSNGYDTSYAPNQDAAKALMMIANSGGGGSSFGNDVNAPKSVYNAVQSGLYGLTAQDVFDTARDPVVNMVRTGLFNERDEDGLPKFYPWADLSKGQGLTLDNTVDEHKLIALQSAQESIVLLKNKNNILPISKDSSLSVVGTFADARFKSTYSVGNTPTYENSAFSPLTGIRTLSSDGENKVKYATGAKVISIQTADGKYLVADTSVDGGAITAQSVNSNTTLAAQFELYEWGQDGFSLLSLANNKWVNVTGNTNIFNNGTQTLNTTENPWDNGLNVGQSNMPFVFRWDYNEDSTVSIISASFGGGFGGGFERAYWTSGRHVYMNGDTLAAMSATLTNESTRDAQRTNGAKFTIKPVSYAGDVVYTAGYNNNDYAVVVVGAPPRHSAGEGSDRSDLAMGNDQYEMVEAVANKYKGRTIVILKTNFPVLMEKIQNNDNVAAVIYQQYAGQYDGYAMGQAIFGDYAPTGKLTSTWYASMDALPDMDSEAISEGDDNKYTLENLDPRFTKDFAQSGPIETGLTYMYTDAEVTYPFGYGLSYSSFEYGEIQQGATLDDGTFEIKVEIKNTGAVDTSEVVQLYVSNPNSIYGDKAPKKQLASFEKVYIKAGESKTVTLNVDPFDFAIWDVNSDDYLVEDGTYNFFVGSDCDTPIKSKEIDVKGGVPAKMLAAKAPVNVFDRSFDSYNITYRELSKVTTVARLSEHEITGYYSVMSKEVGAWTALANADLTNVTGFKFSVASTNANSSFELRIGSPTGEIIAEKSFGATSPITKTMAGNIATTELGYVDVEMDIKENISGIHNLYIVFKDADIRIDTIQTLKEVASTTVLETLIKKAEKIKADGELEGIMPSVVKEFEAALKEAKELVAGEPTEAEVWASQLRLMTAIQLIGDEHLIADKSDLEEAIKLAEFVKESLDKYVDAGKSEFTAALEKAKIVYADDDALASEVESAYIDLMDAILNLKLKANKDRLNSLIEKASVLELSKYSAQSVDNLKVALNKAVVLSADKMLSFEQQSSVDNGVAVLSKAIDNLKLLSDTGTTPKDTTESDKTGSSGAKTGEAGNYYWYILLALSLALTALTAYKKLKKKHIL